MANYNELLFKYRHELEKKDIPFQTAKLFLYELCNERDVDLYTNINKEASQEIIALFEDGIKRILNYEPMNYVLGYAWFYGYKLEVNNDVLVPRYETEELVSNVLSYLDKNFRDYKQISLVDIGTGSGAIAISLAKEEPKLKVIATDISKEAVAVAERNAKKNAVDMSFYVGNMLDPLIDNNIKVDVILCNPPYIPLEEDLEVSVKDFEPNIALFGGLDGLKFYCEVFEKANQILNDKALLAFEIGYDQKDRLESLAKIAFPNAIIKTHKDINGKDRMLFIMK